MAIIKLQGSKELEQGIYYEFDTASRPLGEGGMGKVFKGRRIDMHTSITQDVAIKFMFEGLSPAVIERARREASIQLRNDNLVEMMGFLTTETVDPATGTVRHHYHVVSELLDGVMLADLIQGVVTDNSGNVIPYAQKLYSLYKEKPYAFAVYVIRNVLSGIMALHDKGYIHRDIDPTNIMVTRDEKIKLIDFGIAKKVDNLVTQDKSLTQTGQFMGKAQYAAPELILGDVAHQCKQTDIYAIGILLYQLVTGQLPFNGPTNVVIKAQMQSKVPTKLIRNSKISHIITKATQKEIAKRYQSAEEFRVDLNRVGDNPDEATSTGGSIKWIAVGIAAFVLIIGSILFVNQCRDTNDKDKSIAADTAKVNMASSARFATICQKLHKAETAQAGFEELLRLCQDEPNNVEAAYLLSRLYYPAKTAAETTDSVYSMQVNLGSKIKKDFKKSHDLLKLIANADPSYYPALFELAVDYYTGPARTGGEAQNQTTSRSFFEKALAGAQAKGDSAYVAKCQTWLDKFNTQASTPATKQTTTSTDSKKKNTTTGGGKNTYVPTPTPRPNPQVNQVNSRDEIRRDADEITRELNKH